MNSKISSISRNNRSNSRDGYKKIITRTMVVILVGMIRVLVGIVS